MAIDLTIFPHHHSSNVLRFGAGMVQQANANHVALIFSSKSSIDADDIDDVKSEIRLFHLDETTARLLSLVGNMTIDERKALLGHAAPVEVEA
jgi:hypothetical protein